MTVRNLVIAYPPASTVNSILTTLMEAFTSTGAFSGAGLGYTLIEDSIASDSLFVVQAQQPSESLSQMVIEVRHYNGASIDYIAFVVWDEWSFGFPGFGENSVQVTDPTFTPTTAPGERFHELSTTAGGTFYLDADDTDGRWLSVHSEYDSMWNPVNHYVCVCSIEKSVFPNFGVLVWFTASVPRYLKGDEDSNGCGWIPPLNHVGNSSNNFDPDGARDRAMYMCHPPIFSYSAGVDLTTGSVSGAGADAAQFDSYNNADIVYPLYIHNSTQRVQSSSIRPSGTAFGFRGFARGIFGYRRGAASPTRFNLDDGVTALKYIAYVGDPAPESGVASVLRYAIERA